MNSSRMNPLSRLTLLGFEYLLVLGFVQGFNVEEEKNCTTFDYVCIPKGYNKFSYPPGNVTVSLGFYGDVKKVDDMESTLTLDLKMMVLWQDLRIINLQNTTSLNPGLTDIIWTPSLWITNLRSSKKQQSILWSSEAFGNYLALKNKTYIQLYHTA